MDLDQKKIAFENSYPELFDSVYRYTIYRIPQLQEAEDTVSEIFFTAYKNLSIYDPKKGGLKTWIFQISKRKIIDYWRRQKNIVDLKFLETFPSENEIANNIDHELLIRELNSKLTSEQKAFFALKYIDDLTYEEIAALTCKKTINIRKIFSRMHAHFRKKIQSYH